MRIAQIATLATPVRQHGAGSIETLTWLMSRELTRLGHKVTVFATGDSQVDGELTPTLPAGYGAPGSLDDWQLCEWVNLCRAVEQSGRFDVMHSHGYLWGIPLQPLSRAPIVHTLHIVPDDNAARLWSLYPNSCVTAISRHQWSAFPQLHPAAVIPHGVDVSQFTFREKPGDYVCFFGRFTANKGPRQAIAAARALGLRLVMAGPSNKYFVEHIQPLVDGASVEYIGAVNGAERDRLLGGARALLYPIQYAEPFGLVLAEAMLCGTPVAAMGIGAVPEIVEDGITGYTASSPEEFSQAITRCLSLNRRLVRERAEQRFSVQAMVAGYLRVYESALHGRKEK